MPLLPLSAPGLLREPGLQGIAGHSVLESGAEGRPRAWCCSHGSLDSLEEEGKNT